MKKWLENKTVKVFLVYLLPLLIGGLFSALGYWDYKNDKTYHYFCTIFTILPGT